MTARLHSEPARRALHDGWTARIDAGPAPQALIGLDIPASIPGAIHSDLLAAHLIDDPHLDRNEQIQAWIGLTDFTYTTHFDWAPDARDNVDLVFEGLDTVASITLNGSRLGSMVNMHRSYRFDVADVLHEGKNTLTVEFSSPVKYADAESERIGRRPHTNHHPYNAIRKMACSFGWDWGPDLSTSGIWKPVSLESWSRAALRTIRPIASVQDGIGIVDVHVDVARADSEEVTISATVDGEQAALSLGPGDTSGTVRLEVPDPRLWWPRGMGEQAMSVVDVTLTDAAGNTLDRTQRRVGFRTIEVHDTPDDAGTPFVLRVNGSDIRVRGANWIPDDTLLHRVTREALAQRIGQAEYANVNLLRVWGGGIFESDDFYELCDEAGMLVWQDFLFACAAYADEGSLAEEVEAEARENVARLAAHPALVIWNGNNENLWGHEDWSWKTRLDGLSWGQHYYEKLLPAIVRELSPHVPYTPGSPFSPRADAHPNDPDHGTMHIWDVWNQLDYTAYADVKPRFVAEFGWQGPPTWATLTQAVHDDPLTPESPAMMTHQKAAEGNNKLLDGLLPHFRSPRDMRDWHWAMQLNQAVAMRFGIEHLRSLAPHCSGMIMWQLNDCWPVTSWAAVDGEGRAKPLLDALRSAYSDRLVTVQPRDGALAAVAVNDSASAWNGTLRVQRRTLDGAVLAESEAEVSVAPGATFTLPLPAAVGQAQDETSEYLRAELAGGAVARMLFTEPRRVAFRARPFETTVDRVGGAWAITVRASSLVMDLAILADAVHPQAVASGSLTSIDAGDQAVITVTVPEGIELDALLHEHIVRCANELAVMTS